MVVRRRYHAHPPRGWAHASQSAWSLRVPALKRASASSSLTRTTFCYSTHPRMPEIDPVDLPGLTRPHRAPLRIWYGQPLIVPEPGGPPWRPQQSPGTPTGFELLRHILDAEAAAPYLDGPVLVLLPEYCLRLAEIEATRALVRQSHNNLIVVGGLEQLSSVQALSLEDRPDLWDGPDNGRYTNCAVLISSASGSLFLQPKTLPSQWEAERFWPGRVVRYFAGTNLFLAIQICSDLLAQPLSNAAALAQWLEDKGRRLDAVLWIQHNEKPRSPSFTTSLERYCLQRATVVAVGSKRDRPGRLDNYSVSGAIAPHNALSRHFHLLDKDFHYFEPVGQETSISRAVLLRYDADVHRVTTVLADSVYDAPAIEKGAFFARSEPFVVVDSLQSSPDHFHIEDISAPAAALAASSIPAWAQSIRSVLSDHLVPLSTRDFLAFLDLALLPRPHGSVAHSSGTQHTPSDFRCDCWDHRTCIDLLTETEGASMQAFANVLAALAALRQSNVAFVLRYLPNHRTYLELTLNGSTRYLAVIHPFGLDAAETEARLRPHRDGAALDPGYMILGTKGKARSLVNTVSAELASGLGGTHAGRAVRPGLRAIYQEDFELAFETNDLQHVLESLFAA